MNKTTMYFFSVLLLTHTQKRRNQVQNNFDSILHMSVE